MLCPNCQTEVSNWQFYCPQCRTSLQDYQDFGRSSRRQSFDRVGAHLINLILVLLLLGGSVLVARQIDWKELKAMFKDPGAGVRTDTPGRKPDKSKPGDRRRRVKTESSAQKSDVNASQATSVESVRRLPQKIEELPSPEEVPRESSPAQGQPKKPGFD